LIYVKSEPAGAGQPCAMCFRALIALALAGCALAAQASGPSGTRRAQLVHMVREDCGSCHGMTLAGGLGPPLLPAALAGKADDSLEAVILNGRPGTPMGPWRRFMSEQEARWIVESLKKGFPREE
jgi:cytochrome c55X